MDETQRDIQTAHARGGGYALDDGLFYAARNGLAYWDADAGCWCRSDDGAELVSFAAIQDQLAAEKAKRKKSILDHYDEDGVKIDSQAGFDWESYSGDGAARAGKGKKKQVTGGRGYDWSVYGGSEVVAATQGRMLSAAFVASLATSIADGFGVKAEPATSWRSDPATKTLYYDEGVRRLTADAATALILHEVGHLAYTDTDAKVKKRQKASKRMGPGLFLDWAGSLEDLRIDEKQSQAYPAGGDVLAELEAQTVGTFRSRLVQAEQFAADMRREAEQAAKDEDEAQRALDGHGSPMLTKALRAVRDVEDLIAARESSGDNVPRADMERIVPGSILEHYNIAPSSIWAALEAKQRKAGVPWDYARHYAQQYAQQCFSLSPKEKTILNEYLQSGGRTSSQKSLMYRDAALALAVRAIAYRSVLRTKGVLMPAPVNPDTWLAPEGKKKKGVFSGWKASRARSVYGYDTGATSYSDEYAAKERARYAAAMDAHGRAEKCAAVCRKADVASLPSTVAVAGLFDADLWPIIEDMFPPDFDPKRADEAMKDKGAGGSGSGGQVGSRGEGDANSCEGQGQRLNDAQARQLLAMGKDATQQQFDLHKAVDYRLALAACAEDARDCARRFRRAVRDNALTRYKGRFRSGRLSSRRLYKARVSDDPRPFDRRQAKKDYTFAVSVLIDRSGSMGDGTDSTQFLATQGLAIVGETLKGVRGAAWEATFFADRWMTVKGFGDPLDPLELGVRASLPEIGGGTVIAKPAEEAYRRLARRPEDRKLMVILTDAYLGGGDAGAIQQMATEAAARGVRTLFLDLGGGHAQSWLGGIDRVDVPKITRASDVPAQFVDACRNLLK